MIQQDNDPNHLKEMFKSGLIPNDEYYFRLKANELNINTYKFI